MQKNGLGEQRWRKSHATLVLGFLIENACCAYLDLSQISAGSGRRAGKNGGGEKSILVKRFGRHFGSGECSWSGDLPHSSGPNEWSVTGAGLRCAHGGQLE